MDNKSMNNGGFIAKEEAAVKTQKETKKPKKKEGRTGLFKRIAAKLKDIFSELKKVSWPTFPKVVKQTGI